MHFTVIESISSIFMNMDSILLVDIGKKYFGTSTYPIYEY